MHWIAFFLSRQMTIRQVDCPACLAVKGTRQGPPMALSQQAMRMWSKATNGNSSSRQSHNAD